MRFACDESQQVGSAILPFVFPGTVADVCKEERGHGAKVAGQNMDECGAGRCDHFLF